jgi:DNA-binding transcriptional LysR family regulator
MSFTLRQLRAFVAVAETGSVSEAAHALAVSPSALSEAVRELEADLGLRLFERHARGLRVTQAGHLFLRHARAILDQVAVARWSLGAGARPTLRGELHLGVTALMAGYVISDLLARFRRANPEATVTAIEDAGEYLEHLLIGGELDAAVMVTGTLRARDALRVETIEVSPFRLWLPGGHRLAAREAIALADLAAEPLIMLMVDEMEEETEHLLSALSPKPRVAFRTRSVEAVRSLVATGAGVAILPDLIYRPWSLEGDRIESRDVSGALPVVQVGVVWRRGAPLSAEAHDFILLAQAARR